MTKYSKFNLVYRLQKWMDSVPGQTFLNYAYSWGASVVIAGTLFKLTHLPGANIMLFIGMGTEVVVFFLSAFDRPFDKTADGRDLPTHVDEAYEGYEEYETDGDSDAETDAAPAAGANTEETVGVGAAAAAAAPGYGGTIVIGGAQGQQAAAFVGDGSTDSPATSAAPAGVAVAGGVAGAPAAPGGVWIGQQQENTPEMAEAQSNYVDALNALTDMLQQVSAQSERLTRDSEEMENLNRTLTGITKIYEMQLKAASQQVGTIDQINDQTRKMAGLIEQLNSIYGRMIEAMTVNMRAAAPGAAPLG